MDLYKVLPLPQSNTNDYYYFKNGFSDEDISKVSEIVKTAELTRGTVGDKGEVVDDYRNSSICWIPYTPASDWLYKKIADFAIEANTELWQLEISSMSESIQYSVYSSEQQQHYHWHMDCGSGTMARRKVSVVVQLSTPEEYEGGNLEFHIRKDTFKAPQQKGDVIVFPSFFMHRVTPVTKGVRKSLVIWISGPPFK